MEVNNAYLSHHHRDILHAALDVDLDAASKSKCDSIHDAIIMMM